MHELLAARPGFEAAACRGLKGSPRSLELLRDHLCANDVRLNFTRLDRGRCYTIGFRHPSFHPMTADPRGSGTSRHPNLASGALHHSSGAGGPLAGLPCVPHQALYSREDIIRLAEAGGRRGVGSDGTGLQLADLDHISRTALEDAKAIIAGASPDHPVAVCDGAGRHRSRLPVSTTDSSFAPEVLKRQASTRTSSASHLSSAGSVSSFTGGPPARPARLSTKPPASSIAPSERTSR